MQPPPAEIPDADTADLGADGDPPARRRRLSVTRGSPHDPSQNATPVAADAMAVFHVQIDRGAEHPDLVDTQPASTVAVVAFHQAVGAADEQRPAHDFGVSGVPPVPAPPPEQRFQCPLCRPYSTTGELRMLLAHVSTAHSGEHIGA